MVSHRLATSSEHVIAHHSPALQRRGLPPHSSRTPEAGLPRHRLLKSETLIAHLSPSMQKKLIPSRPLMLSSDSESEYGDDGFHPAAPVGPFLTPLMSRRGVHGGIREAHSAHSSPLLSHRTLGVSSSEQMTLSHEDRVDRASQMHRDEKLVVYMQNKDEAASEPGRLSRATERNRQSRRRFFAASETTTTQRTETTEITTSSSGPKLAVPGHRRRYVKREGAGDGDSDSVVSAVTLEVPSISTTSSRSPSPLRRVSHNPKLCPDALLRGSTSSLHTWSSMETSDFHSSYSSLSSPGLLRRGMKPRSQDAQTYEKGSDLTAPSLGTLLLPQPIQTFHSPQPSPLITRKAAPEGAPMSSDSETASSSEPSVWLHDSDLSSSRSGDTREQWLRRRRRQISPSVITRKPQHIPAVPLPERREERIRSSTYLVLGPTLSQSSDEMPLMASSETVYEKVDTSQSPEDEQVIFDLILRMEITRFCSGNMECAFQSLILIC